MKTTELEIHRLMNLRTANPLLSSEYCAMPMVATSPSPGVELCSSKIRIRRILNSTAAQLLRIVMRLLWSSLIRSFFGHCRTHIRRFGRPFVIESLSVSKPVRKPTVSQYFVSSSSATLCPCEHTFVASEVCSRSFTELFGVARAVRRGAPDFTGQNRSASWQRCSSQSTRDQPDAFRRVTPPRVGCAPWPGGRDIGRIFQSKRSAYSSY